MPPGRVFDGGTPFSIASKKGHYATVKLLLGKVGIQVNRAPPNTGVTPLLAASINGHKAVVSLLLKKDGILANLPDFWGNTPLTIAALSRYGKIVEMLLRNPDVRAIGWQGWRPHRYEPYPRDRQDIRLGVSPLRQKRKKT